MRGSRVVDQTEDEIRVVEKLGPYQNRAQVDDDLRERVRHLHALILYVQGASWGYLKVAHSFELAFEVDFLKNDPLSLRVELLSI
jgi:hypothetical protein